MNLDLFGRDRLSLSLSVRSNLANHGCLLACVYCWCKTRSIFCYIDVATTWKDVLASDVIPITTSSECCGKPFDQIQEERLYLSSSGIFPLAFCKIQSRIENSALCFLKTSLNGHPLTVLYSISLIFSSAIPSPETFSVIQVQSFQLKGKGDSPLLCY